MTSHIKKINMMLFISLVLFVNYWQSLLPWRPHQVAKAPLFHYTWIAGVILTLIAITAFIMWLKNWRAKQLRLSEVLLPALIAISSAFVTWQVYTKWNGFRL